MQMEQSQLKFSFSYREGLSLKTTKKIIKMTIAKTERRGRKRFGGEISNRGQLYAKTQ